RPTPRPIGQRFIQGHDGIHPHQVNHRYVQTVGTEGDEFGHEAGCVVGYPFQGFAVVAVQFAAEEVDQIDDAGVADREAVFTFDSGTCHQRGFHGHDQLAAGQVQVDLGVGTHTHGCGY